MVALSVLMPMMQIGPVRVSMHDPLVTMPVSVASGFSISGVLMSVMAVIVTVGVLVLQCFVRMNMFVTVAKNEDQGSGQNAN